MTKKNELVKDEKQLPVASGGIPAELAAALAEYAPNAGMENVDPTDLKRPFYRILQNTSKEVNSGSDVFMEQARMGQIIESAVSRELFSELKIVPLRVIKGYSEFTPQSKGGGFLGFYQDGHERVLQATDKDYCTKLTPEANELKRTYQLFFLTDPVAKQQAVLGIMSFTGTALKKIKTFLTYTMSLGVPFFAKEYKITTEPHVNKAWNSTTFLPNFNVDQSAFVSPDIALVAGKLHQQLDDLSLQAMVEATAEAPEAAPDDDVAATVDASMK